MAYITGIEVGREHKYSDGTALALTTAFQEISFGFLSVGINLANRQSGRWIAYSFDGTNTHGVLLDTDTQPRQLLLKSVKSIWLKGQSGGESYHLDAWGG